MMIGKIWLAALLGIVLGVGLAVTPHPTLTPQPQVFMQSNPVAGTTAKPTNQSDEYVLFAVIVGLVLGTPFFFVAKRRNR